MAVAPSAVLAPECRNVADVGTARRRVASILPSRSCPAGAYWRKAWDEAASPPGALPPAPAYAREKSSEKERKKRDIRYTVE